MIDAYVAPENYAQEGTPVREGKGGFTAVANGSTLFSSKYTRLGWNADTQVYSWNNAGNDVISGMKQGAMVEDRILFHLITMQKENLVFVLHM